MIGADPNIYMNFANSVTQGQPLTQLGGQAAGLVKQMRQKKAMEQAQQQYQLALTTYMDDQTPDNLQMLYQAGEPLGKFQEIQQQVEGMNEAQRKVSVEQNMAALAPLVSGDISLATEMVDSRIAALQANGDEQQAKLWQNIRKSLEEGDTDSARTFISVLTGVTEEGRAALENLSAFEKNRREQVMDEANLIRMGANLEWGSEADKRRAMAAADGLNMPVGRALMELGSVKSAQGMDSAELTTQFQNLRKEYNDYIEDFDISLNSADQIQALVESGANTGMLDAALLDYFNRVSNPDAVVRQSDVARTEDAQGLWRQVENLRGKLERGTSFTQDTRQDMLDVVQTVRGIVEQAKQESSGAIDSSLQRISGEDEEFLTQARREVFGPNWGLDREEEQPEKKETETETGANLPDATRQALNRQISEWNNVPLEEIQALSIEEIQRRFERGWNAFMEQEVTGDL